MTAPRLTLRGLTDRKRAGERIVMLTCYDALFAQLLDVAGVDILLVGDSLNQVLAGRNSTLSATLDQMIYHAASVRRGTERVPVVIDLPFLTYQVSIEDAIRNAGRAMAETDCDGVKLEGGQEMADTVRALVERGIPVIGHLGFTPQSVHALGGYRVQGRGAEAAKRMIDDARSLEQAGASAVVLEMVPRETAKSVTEAIGVPTIGIGAGPHCDGQVLVLHDMLGLNESFSPRFLKRFGDLGAATREAVQRYAAEVRDGSWPGDEHSFD